MEELKNNTPEAAEDTSYLDSIFSETTSPLAERVHATAVERRRKRVRTHQILRAAIQLIAFILMPGAFYAGFEGVKTIAENVGTGAVIPFDGHVKALVFLLIFTIIFGRFFCGYLCSFGALGDLVYALVSLIPKKLLKRKKGYSVSPKLRKKLQLVKYLNLAVIILMAVFAVTPQGWSCFDSFIDLAYGSGIGPAAGFVCLLVMILLMGVQERGFCQFLCPLGALFALLPILPTGTLHRRAENCPEGCHDCQSSCPAALLLQENGDRGGECYGCDNCIGICPKNNLSHAEDFIFRNDIIAAVLKTVIFLALGICFGLCRFM